MSFATDSVNNRARGRLTVIELFVVLVIIIILAGVAWPSFTNANDKVREAAVKANMHTVQMAAEAYANDSGGKYPETITDAFKGYFAGGPADGTSAGQAKGPTNPYSKLPEWPVLGKITDLKAARSSAPTMIGSAGQLEYTPIGTPPDIVDFAVRGADKNGRALAGSEPNSTLILSRQ